MQNFNISPSKKSTVPFSNNSKSEEFFENLILRTEKTSKPNTLNSRDFSKLKQEIEDSDFEINQPPKLDIYNNKNSKLLNEGKGGVRMYGITPKVKEKFLNSKEIFLIEN